MADPLRPPAGAMGLGAGGVATPTSQRWEQGCVVEYNSGTHTATVRTNRGRTIPNVPQMRSAMGAFEHLSTGTPVVITWDLGIPVIIGILDDVGLPQKALPSMSLTGVEGVGSTDPTQATHGTNNYRPPFAPTDLGPNDYARVGTMGNHVAVLEGGLSLFGSATAQLRSLGTSGMMQTIARAVQQVTDFGLVSTENDQGKTSFVLRAGSNQSTETGLDEQRWTIRMDLGASGDLFDFRILEPEGKLLFRMHVGSDGRVQIYGDGGVDLSSGANGAGNARGEHAGPRTQSIGGNDTKTIAGDKTTIIDQSHTTTVGGDVERAAGGALTEFSAGNRAVATGGAEARVVADTRTTTVGSDDKLAIDGKWSVLAKKGVRLESKGEFDIKAAGRARIDGQQVVLGTNGNHPLPKFDVFLQDLGTFLADLQTALGNAVPVNPFAVAAYMAKIAFFTAKVNTGFAYKSTTVKND
jgi:hypothetical protein